MQLIRYITFIILIVTVSLYSQQYRDTFNSIQVNFSDTMSIVGLTDVDNYEVITDVGDTLEITAVWLPNDHVYTKVAVLMEQISWTVQNFTIKCFNLKNTQDSLIDLEKNFANVSFRNNITKPNPNLVEVGSVKKLVIVDAIASKISQPEYIPAHVFDGDTVTIWTAEPIPQYIDLELQHFYHIIQINIALNLWYTGRIYILDIYYSESGIVWTPLLFGINSDIALWTSIQFLMVEAQYIRIVTVGNNQSLWANIKEIEIYGY